MGFETIVLPAIGTGILNFPKELFAEALFETILAYLSKTPNSKIKTIRLTNIYLTTVTYLTRELVKRFGAYGNEFSTS